MAGSAGLSDQLWGFPLSVFFEFCRNPYFIDLDVLCEEGLLTEKECKSYSWGQSVTEVDYSVLYENRYPLLHKAFERFRRKIPGEYVLFCEEQADWLNDYALFMALKDAHDGVSWNKWETKLKLREKAAIDMAKREFEKEIEFYKMVQYLFYRQWKALKQYANDKGVCIIGDVPIYVAMDSADVWAEPGSSTLIRNCSRLMWRAALRMHFPRMDSFGAIRCSAGT